MKALIKFILTSIGLVLILISVGLLLFGKHLEPLLRMQGERVLTQIFGGDVSIEGIKAAPLQAGFALSGLRIENPEPFPREPALSCQQVTVWLEPASLVTRRPVLRQVLIEEAEFHLRPGEGKGNNFTALEDAAAAYADAQQKAGWPEVEVHELRCEESLLRVSPGSPMPTTLPPFATTPTAGDDALPLPSLPGVVLKHLAEKIVAQAPQQQPSPKESSDLLEPLPQQ